MQAKTLPLPDADSCKYVMDGQMREIWAYDILADAFKVRWDTMIDNIQYHFVDTLPHDKQADLTEKRLKAYRFFQDLEGLPQIADN